MVKKLAIIGASSGQVPLLLKARELGIFSLCFAWEKGAVGKDIPDIFYPISIFDYTTIIEICKKENIIGITSNASDVTAQVVSYLTNRLGLNGIKYDNFINLKNKYFVRSISNKIEGLTPIKIYKLKEITDNKLDNFPYVVKPEEGAGKKGVEFIHSARDFKQAIEYARKADENGEIIIEECVSGKEISVETLSYHGKHYIIQITDKINSGPPHFVELEHHQPAILDEKKEKKLKIVINQLFNKLGIDNCACHVEFKINGHDIYLIEVNPRGGGDEISNQLVYLSTGFDYLKALIEISMNDFNPQEIKNMGVFAGIYFLCEQSKHIKRYFDIPLNEKPDWMVERKITDPVLREGTSNWDRNGYLIYKSNKKIEL